MSEPTGIQQLENLGQDVLALMIRHDQLRPLVHSIITEQELNIEKFSETEWQRSAKIYRQRYNLSSAEDVKQHCKKHGFNQNQFQWQVLLQVNILRSSKRRLKQKEMEKNKSEKPLVDDTSNLSFDLERFDVDKNTKN